MFMTPYCALLRSPRSSNTEETVDAPDSRLADNIDYVRFNGDVS